MQDNGEDNEVDKEEAVIVFEVDKKEVLPLAIQNGSKEGVLVQS